MVRSSVPGPAFMSSSLRIRLRVQCKSLSSSPLFVPEICHRVTPLRQPQGARVSGLCADPSPCSKNISSAHSLSFEASSVQALPMPDFDTRFLADVSNLTLESIPKGRVRITTHGILYWVYRLTNAWTVVQDFSKTSCGSSDAASDERYPYESSRPYLVV